ncbi:DUF5723 family protein [Salmonirosea aquatica]|uniref:DUF5723 domain-containing protein n=1 Tax=Salmonirosea aquatica TaxID=2654236 RepID=A0A7C9BCS9_9BACT|nr:hypothetical protein [Cytophagaceae bacterium SJW1-29]
MKFSHSPLLALLTLLLNISVSQAQQVPGLSLSNYGGLYRATQNPSVLGGSRYKWQVNLVTAGSTINNRYFIFFGRNSYLYPLLVPHSTHELYGRSRTMGSITAAGTPTAYSPLHVASEVRWPSVMFSVGKNHGFAFQVRSRGFVQGNNIPQAIRTMYYRRLDTPATPTASGTWGDFDLSQQNFSEASASYGLQLINLRAHKLKVGGTLKRVFGARAGYLQGSVDAYEIRQVDGGDADEKELVLNNFSYESGYTQPNQSWRLGDVLNGTKYGTGWGYDLGATYELGSHWGRLEEDDDARPGYLIRFSASITDLGSIHYQSPDSRVVSGNEIRTVIDQQQLETLGNEGADGFASIFPGPTETILKQDAHLPTTLHWDVDVQLVKSFYINVAKVQRYGDAPQSPLDLTQPDALIITPRFENEDSDFSLPLTFMKGNKYVSMGALARFGPFHLGFSNLNGLLNRKDQDATRATFMYMGFSVWKFKDRKLGIKKRWQPFEGRQRNNE